MPFLNSTMLLPSERATDGNRPPNRMTATMPKDQLCRADSHHCNSSPAD